MSDKLFATVTTVVYIIILITLIAIFTHLNIDSKKPIHYISKRGEAITVSLVPSTHINRHHHNKIKHKIKRKTKHKTRHKKVVKRAKAKKIVKVKKQHKSSKKYTKKTKKVETKKLFSSINSNKQTTKTAKKKKSNGEGNGVLNRYLASIEKRLRGWPAQSNFAGEEIDVRLKIYPSGQFDYKVMRYSDNQAFNDALISYLEQLRRYGFDPHSGNRAYEIEVKFIAHQ